VISVYFLKLLVFFNLNTIIACVTPTVQEELYFETCNLKGSQVFPPIEREIFRNVSNPCGARASYFSTQHH